MNEFISQGALWQRLEALTHGSQNRLWMAVAYWGAGAEAKLGLERAPSSFRLICDLRSGGCNPHTIESIWKKRRDAVRYFDDLHAKVYLGDGAAIVGSANASAGGTGWEGDEANCLLEAAIEVEDSETLDSIAKWMADLWSKAKPITDDELKAAKETWRRRRANRPRSNSPKDDLVDREIFILWDDLEAVTKKEKAAFAAWKGRTRTESNWDFFSDTTTSWIPPGATFVFVRKDAHSYVDGVGETFDSVLEPLERVRLKGGGFIIPVRTERVLMRKRDGVQIRLSVANRKKIFSYVQDHAERNPQESWGLIPLSDVL